MSWLSVISFCWKESFPYTLLGDGSNILVSDAGVHGLVIINRTRQTRFDEQSDPPLVWAESGANFGVLARQAAQRGLSGLEWAAGIPGTLGGAVVGNAGAHGGELAHNLRLAEILHRMDAGRVGEPQREEWPVEKLEFTYRSSLLKRNPGKHVVLAGLLQLERGDPQAIREQDGRVGGLSTANAAARRQHRIDVQEPAWRLCRSVDRSCRIERRSGWRCTDQSIACQLLYKPG